MTFSRSFELGRTQIAWILLLIVLLLVMLSDSGTTAMDQEAKEILDTFGPEANKTVRIRAYKDATLIQSSYAGCNGSCADSKFGLSPVLQLGSYHLVAEVVMGFILSPPVPTQAQVQSCRLVLPTKAITIVGNSHVLVRRITPGGPYWAEEDVTWNTRPDLDRKPLGWVNMLDASLTNSSSSNYTSDSNATLSVPGVLDIDPKICEQSLQVDSEIGFNLQPELGAFISFSSREDTSPSSQQAVLEITFWCCPDLAQARSLTSSASKEIVEGTAILGFLIIAAIVTGILSLPFHFPL